MKKNSVVFPGLSLLLFSIFPNTVNAQLISTVSSFQSSVHVPAAPYKQAIEVTGKVTGQSGEPLGGVVIEVKGKTKTTVTNGEGIFTITVDQPNETLVISYVGYVTQEISLNNRTNLNISMALDTKTLADVVVIGYGTQKKGDITGAVSMIKTENLDERPLTRVDQALVGQLAGVAVKQTTGTPGRGFSIQVRGTGSISAGNEPLYVIDGFPLTTASPNAAGGFGTGNPLDNINPNDIESIQVLKDAAAGAIYGSRAANGVVLITTKRGKTGKPNISFNTYLGFSEASRKLEMLDGPGWIDRATEIINAQWVASGRGRTADQTNEQRRQILNLAPGAINTSFMLDPRWALPDDSDSLRFINWQDETFRRGLMQNYQLSGSGGNEFVKYYISGNYTRQEGIIKNVDYTAFSARANVEIMASKKFKFGLNVAPTYSITNDPGVEGKDNILHQLTSMTPVQEDTFGLYANSFEEGQYLWSVTTNSPVAKLENIIGQSRRFRTINSIYIEYEPIEDLVFKTTANLDNTDNNTNSYTPYTVSSSLASRQIPNVNTSGVFTAFRRQTFVNENTLSYNKRIKDDHDISLLAGASYTYDKLDNVRIASSGGYSSSVITTLNAASAVTGNTQETRNVLISYFGRAQYNFNGKYLLSATIRTDGSSRFGQNTKWGVFPSASIGWRVSDEAFMNGIEKISDLKLRASWGQAGNYNIGDYSSIPLLGSYNYTLNGTQVFGQAPSGITNPDLRWERSETVNLGVDIGILQNRIFASFDIYSRLSKDLLLNVPIAQVTGFPTALTNVGSVRNKGWELELSTRNITGEFLWTTSVNFSHNSNKVLALGPGATSIQIPSLFDVPHSILQIGQPMYSIYVVRQIGILTQEDISKNVARYGTQAVGDPKYFDANGDGVINANDRVIVGHPNPDYTWGITNTFKYKGFDLMVLVQGQWGGSIYSLFGRAIDRTGQGFTDNTPAFYKERWRSTADPGAGLKGKAYSTFGRIVNTDWLYPTDYWRIRNITLGYDLGKTIRSNFIHGIRAYATLENFFGRDKYKGGYNPEATNTDLSGNASFPEPGDYGGLPLPRSLVVGLNFTF